jgi:glycosyltransferase involved in cell wall biosynthesis
MNALGSGVTHSIVATDGVVDACQRIASDIDYRIVSAPGKNSFGALGFAQLLRDNPADLVLTYNWGSMDAVMAACLLRVAPVIHAEDGFHSDESQRRKLRRVWTRQIFLNQVALTVVPSQTLERIALEEFHIRRSLLTFVPNGVDCGRFSPGDGAEVRSRLGLPLDALVFGYVGHLRPEKNLELLVDAFADASVPGSRLLLIGEGERLEALRRKVAERNIGDQAVFAGAVNDTAPYYRAMDVFALSSLTEQMSISQLEAMASGLPGVCTDVGDCRNLFGLDSEHQVVPPRDRIALAQAFRHLGSHAALRKRLGSANRLRCQQVYSDQVMLDRYEQLYLGILAGTGHSLRHTPE